jgi:Flp pilus assembly protein TadD
LAKIGFALARSGVVDEAEQVFAGLAESAPEKDGPVAGLALCHIIKGECERALGMLDERLARGSVIAAELGLYRILALGMAGRLAEARDARDAMERDGQADAVATADALLVDLAKK